MSRVALLLFCVVLLTHYGYPVLASFYPDAVGAARAWFYVLRGLEGAVLFGVLLLVYLRQPLVSAVCLWGLLEEGQTAICRLAAGIGHRPQVGLWSGLCDDLTGWPIYALSLGLVALLALKQAGKN